MTPTTLGRPTLEPLPGRGAAAGGAGASERGLDALPQSMRLDLDHLANLPDNWDERGGGAYPRPQLERVARWWREFAREYRSEFSRMPPTPGVGQAEGQSIDLHWDGDFSFLVNVPADEGEPCAFYGFSVLDPGMGFHGKSPLRSLGGIIKPRIRDFFGRDA